MGSQTMRIHDFPSSSWASNSRPVAASDAPLPKTPSNFRGCSDVSVSSGMPTTVRSPICRKRSAARLANVQRYLSGCSSSRANRKMPFEECSISDRISCSLSLSALSACLRSVMSRQMTTVPCVRPEGPANGAIFSSKKRSLCRRIVCLRSPSCAPRSAALAAGKSSQSPCPISSRSGDPRSSCAG